MCPGLWLLATVGPASLSMVSWGSPTPPTATLLTEECPVILSPVDQVLKEAGTCIGSHPTSQSKGQIGAGDRWRQIQPSLACLLSHGRPRCQVPEAQAARNTVSILILPVAGYGVGWHSSGTSCGPSSLERASPTQLTACTPGWPELLADILTPGRRAVPGS